MGSREKGTVLYNRPWSQSMFWRAVRIAMLQNEVCVRVRGVLGVDGGVRSGIISVGEEMVLELESFLCHTLGELSRSRDRRG